MVQRLLAALSLVTAFMVVPYSAPATASTLEWTTELSDVQPQELLTAPDGSVTAATCSTANSGLSAKTLSATGIAVREISKQAFQPCDAQKATGRDNTLYGVMSEAGRQTLAAFKDKTPLWEYSFDQRVSCDGSRLSIFAIQVGADGNIHTLLHQEAPGCSQQWFLAGLTPAKVLLYFEQIGNADLRWFRAYRNGLVAFGGNQLRYFSYKGTLQGQAVPLQLGSGEWVDPHLPVVDFDGQVYLAINRSTGSSSECNEPTTTVYLAAYSAQGKLGSLAQPECSIAISASAGPWGAVFAGRQHNGESDWYATVGRNGQQLRRQTLPMHENSHNYAVTGHAPRVFGDANGNILLERAFRHSQTSLPGSDVWLLNAADGTEVDSALNQDAVTSGYSVQQLALAPGILYLLGTTCPAVNCSGGTPFVLTALSMPKLGLDYPRAALLKDNATPEEPEERIYFLGDSYMAGPGIKPQEEESGDCQRSKRAWPYQLEQNHLLNIKIEDLYACTGDTMDDMLSEEGQLSNNFSPTTTKVVISIGGNDIEFKNLIFACILYDCRNRVNHTKRLIKELDEEYGKLIAAIRGKLGDDAEIYFTGYPYVLPLNKCSSAPGWMNTTATFLRRGLAGEAVILAAAKLLVKDLDLSWHDVRRNFFASGLSFSDAEVIAVNQLQGRFNNQIRESVTKRGAHFVSMTGPDSPFRGHELCPAKGKESYFFGVEAGAILKGEVTRFFHPNEKGARAYAEAFAKYYLKEKDDTLS